jgi:hypothetical protein
MDVIVFCEKIFSFIFSEKQLKNFENKLFILYNSNLKKFYLNCFLQAFIFSILSFILFFYLNFNLDKQFVFSIIIFLSIFLFNYLWIDIKFEKLKRKKEALLAELLLEASVFFDENSFLKNIEKMKNIDLPFSKDFHRVLLEINNGSSILEAFQRMKDLNQSKSIDRVIDLFLHGYTSGIQMQTLLMETAQDLLENNSIIKERQAVMLVTKYTLFLACALIVPAIIGLITSLVSSFDFATMSNLEIGLSLQKREELFNFAVLGAGIYIVEFVILSSFFLAIQENNKKQFWIFVLFLLPIALLCFFISQTLI